MKTLSIIMLIAITTQAQTMKNYTMDKKYFSCKIPSNWDIEREKENDEKNKIYKVTLKEPKSITTITIKYYAPESKKDYKTYIETQSTPSDETTEKYEKNKEIEIKGRKAIEINRKLKEYESIQVYSSAYWLKEKIIAIPAKKGFYVFIYSSKEENFNKNLPIFEKVLDSLKMLY